MNPIDVMAVVVSFNGGQKTVKTINALIGQVGHVHIVDNSSGPGSVALLEDYSNQPKVSVNWLTENKGVGYALNLGVLHARELGYQWLLTMDQDSICDDVMVKTLVKAVAEDPAMVCLAPQYSEFSIDPTEGVRLVGYAITSGNLVRIDVFDKIGLYNEDLFIDGVDFDFSLRVRNAGLNIHMVGAARMQHELGDKACTFPLLGRFHTFHSPLRRYYIFRNYLYLVNGYGGRFPKFVLKMTVSHIIYIFTILLFGEQRLKSMFYISHGILDYFQEKKGPYQKIKSSK